MKNEVKDTIDDKPASIDATTKDQGIGVMSVKVIDHNSIAIGVRYENGAFKSEYKIYSNQVNTEQKVLAWIHDLCTKGDWVDKNLIKSFITCCESIHPTLDVFNKD